MHLGSAYNCRIARELVHFRLIYVDCQKIYASVTQAGSTSDEENQGVIMISKKMVVIIAASALAFGLSASAASAKHVKHAKHHAAKHTTVAKVEAMKPVPGNNPLTIASTRDVPKNAPKPEATKGNNPMPMAGAATPVKDAKKPDGIKGNNPMGVAAK
jgi:hypothetical protein